jgi:hypothetical protein
MAGLVELVDGGRSLRRVDGNEWAELLVEQGTEDPDAGDRWRERFRDLTLWQLCRIVCGEADI